MKVTADNPDGTGLIILSLDDVPHYYAGRNGHPCRCGRRVGHGIHLQPGDDVGRARATKLTSERARRLKAVGHQA